MVLQTNNSWSVCDSYKWALMLKQWWKKRNVSDEQITKVLIIINEEASALNIASNMKNYNEIEIDNFSLFILFVFFFLRNWIVEKWLTKAMFVFTSETEMICHWIREKINSWSLERNIFLFLEHIRKNTRALCTMRMCSCKLKSTT